MFVTRIILRKSLSQRCTSAARFLNTVHNTNADEKRNADRKSKKTQFKLLMLQIFILEQTIFTNAALDYDKINDFASLGMHRIWRKAFIDRLGPTNNTKLIDMAGGTGNRDFQNFVALIHFLKVLQLFSSSNMSKIIT
jgi:hypothetical protein